MRLKLNKACCFLEKYSVPVHSGCQLQKFIPWHVAFTKRNFYTFVTRRQHNGSRTICLHHPTIDTRKPVKHISFVVTRSVNGTNKRLTKGYKQAQEMRKTKKRKKNDNHFSEPPWQLDQTYVIMVDLNHLKWSSSH